MWRSMIVHLLQKNVGIFTPTMGIVGVLLSDNRLTRNLGPLRAKFLWVPSPPVNFAFLRPQEIRPERFSDILPC